MSLVSLVYVSFASRPMTDDDLRDILTVARETNKTLDITGMLLYRDGFFIQVLEGEREAVDGLYAKIARDPRHRNVIMVYENDIAERTFGKWFMGFNKVDESNVGELEGYIDFLSEPHPELFLNDHNRAKRLLEAFREKVYF